MKVFRAELDKLEKERSELDSLFRNEQTAWSSTSQRAASNESELSRVRNDLDNRKTVLRYAISRRFE
jgi:hypothetical protein